MFGISVLARALLIGVEPMKPVLVDQRSKANPAAALKVAPPEGTYCTIESAVVVQFEYLDSFQTMCEHQGGTLHKSPSE